MANDNARRALMAAVIEQQKIIDKQSRHISALENAVTFISKASGLDRHVAKIVWADVNNPAQPVAPKGKEPASQSSEDARAPAAHDDPTKDGGTDGANNWVAPDAATTVNSLYDTVLAPAPSAAQDVMKVTDNSDLDTGDENPNGKTLTDVHFSDPNRDSDSAFPWEGGPAKKTITSNKTAGELPPWLDKKVNGEDDDEDDDNKKESSRRHAAGNPDEVNTVGDGPEDTGETPAPNAAPIHDHIVDDKTARFVRCARLAELEFTVANERADVGNVMSRAAMLNDERALTNDKLSERIKVYEELVPKLSASKRKAAKTSTVPRRAENAEVPSFQVTSSGLAQTGDSTDDDDVSGILGY